MTRFGANDRAVDQKSLPWNQPCDLEIWRPACPDARQPL